MAEMKKMPIITISREYGAGGRSVAEELSQRLGVEYYDKDFVKMTAQESGYSEEDIRRVGEDMSKKTRFMNTLFNVSSYTSEHDAIFQAERDVVLELSKKGPCIIVGRCSNVILREVGIPTFDVFLYADMDHKVKRAIELGENGDIVPEKYVNKIDNYRNVYYKTYTGYEMGDYHNYHVCLDTGKIGIEKAVDIIIEALNA